jgi:eukaryotic-like serine/threonine-protein kinase
MRSSKAACHRRSCRVSGSGQLLGASSCWRRGTRAWPAHVQTFPTPGDKWRISTDGGTRPVWRRDGKELFFIAANQKLMAVEVADRAQFEYGSPMPLFDTHLQGDRDPWFDVGADGRFLVPTQIEPTPTASLHVIVNWPASIGK